jgi:anthranilate phosphoribosyltransferase
MYTLKGRGGRNQAHARRPGGRRGAAVWSLILYNAALRLWMAGEDRPLVECVKSAEEVMHSGAALELLSRL